MRQTITQIEHICRKTKQSIHEADIYYGAGLLWGRYFDKENIQIITCYYTTPGDFMETVLSVTGKAPCWRSVQQAAEELSRHDLGGEYFVDYIEEETDVDKVLFNDNEVNSLLMRLSTENILYEYECLTGEHPDDLQHALEYLLDVYCLEEYVTVWDAWHQIL